MKRLILLFIILNSVCGNAFAQISKIVVGVDGLTCPLCSRGVELSLRKLKFVDEIKMDLENTTAELIVRKNAQISLNEIIEKVDDSGFTVRFCDLVIVKSDDVKITSDCIFTNDLLFIISGVNTPAVSDTLRLRIADRAFNNIKDNLKNMVVIDDTKTTCNLSEGREPFYVIVL